MPGLYVAGGLGGHSNGLIGLATYDGKVVADGIAADLPRLAPCDLPEQEVARERQRLDVLRDCPGEGLVPVKIKERLRQVMWDKAGVEKDAASLRSGLGDIEQIRLDLIPRMRLQFACAHRELRVAGRHRRRQHDRRLAN